MRAVYLLCFVVRLDYSWVGGSDTVIDQLISCTLTYNEHITMSNLSVILCLYTSREFSTVEPLELVKCPFFRVRNSMQELFLEVSEIRERCPHSWVSLEKQSTIISRVFHDLLHFPHTTYTASPAGECERAHDVRV